MILGDLILGANVLGSGESAAIDQALPATILGTVTYPVTGEQSGVYSGQPAGLATITPAAQTVGGSSTDTTVFTPANIQFFSRDVTFSVNTTTQTLFTPAQINFYSRSLLSNDVSSTTTDFSKSEINFNAVQISSLVTQNEMTLFTPAQINFYSQQIQSFVTQQNETVFSHAEFGFYAQTLAAGAIVLGNPKYIFDLKYSVKSFDYIL